MSAVNRQPHGPVFPHRQGIYALILSLPVQQSIIVGRLGTFTFQPGFYIYVGSASGPGGLAGRLKRHCLSPTAANPFRKHWHIDYLRQHAGVEQIWFAQIDRQHEHTWAEAAGQLPGASIPVPGFGSSDCRCLAHLFHFVQLPDAAAFRHRLGQPGSEVRIASCSDLGGGKSF